MSLLGGIIYKRRKEFGLSRCDIAANIGLSEYMVGSIERGKPPNIADIFAIAILLEIHPMVLARAAFDDINKLTNHIA